MPNAVSKIKLSQSTAGKGILITATSTAGTQLHVTSNSATVYDELWIYLENPYTADIVATIEFGGVTNPGQTIVVNVPYKQGPILAVPGLSLFDGGGGALTVACFAATGSQITAFGYVNRVTPGS